LTDQKQGGPGTERTQLRALAIAGLFGGLGGWLVVVVSNAMDMVAPEVPWSAPIALWLAAAAVGILAYSTYQRIQVRRHFIEPQRAVAYLVLGKASALAGALIAVGYLVFGLFFVSRLDAASPRDRVIHSAVAALAGVAVCIAGLLLERACIIPKSGDDDEATSGNTPE
jgi:hypothetical protein